MFGAAVGELAGKAVDQVLDWHKAKKGRESVFEANQKNLEQQERFAQQGITWRVQDAKNAGLHPLFALGGGGASFSPSFQAFTDSGRSSSFQDMGQSLGRAYDATQDEEAKALKQAQLRVLESQAEQNNAQAALARSESMRMWMNPSKGLGFDGGGIKADPFWMLSTDALRGAQRGVEQAAVQNPIKPGQIKSKASEVVSNFPGDMSREAGTKPAMTEYTVSPWGLKALAYSSEEGYGESRENMTPAEFFLVNIGKYGLGWLDQYVKQVLMGKAPKYVQHVNRTPRGWSSEYKRGPGRSQ